MLRFRLFGIPVGVHVTFLLIVVLGPLGSVQSAALWVGAVFIAILLHEFGHALTARAFGAQGLSVTLYGLGGLTSFRPGTQISHGKSFLISAAGSAVGIAAGLAVVGLGRLGVFETWPEAPVEFLEYFVWAALVWGILNWVPIVPLDGGHMTQHLIAVFNEEKAPFFAQIVTWVAVAVIVPLAVWQGFYFGAAIVVFFAFAGFKEYRQSTQPKADPEGEEEPLPPRDRPEPPEFPI